MTQQQYMDFAPPPPRIPRQSIGAWLVTKLVIAFLTWPFILGLSALIGYRPSAVDSRRFTGERGRWPFLTGVSVFIWLSGLMAVFASLLLTPIALIAVVPLMILTAARVASSPYGLPVADLVAGARDPWAVSLRWRKAAQVSLGALALAAVLGVLLYTGRALYWSLPGQLELIAVGAVALATLLGMVYAREVGARHRDGVQRVQVSQSQLAAAVGGLFGMTAERVLEAGIIQPNGDGSFVLSPVPAAAALRGRDELESRVAQLLPELTIVAFTAERIDLGPLPKEIESSREIMSQSNGLIVGMADEPDTALRPMAVRWSLAPGTSPAAAPQAAAYAQAKGLSLVEWAPYESYAVVAKLDAGVAQLRARLAELSRCQPWEIELSANHDLDGDALSEITLVRVPTIEDSSKRAESWMARIQQLVPAIAKTRWAVEDRTALDGTIVVARSIDPLATVQPYPTDAKPTLTAIPFAALPNGKTLTLGLLEMNSLLGGIPGGGKSGGATTLLTGIAKLENVAIIGLDPKLVELTLWEPRFSVIATQDDHASAVLAALVDEMHRRYEWLRTQGLKKISPAQLSPELPLIVVMIDELADLVSVGTSPEEKKAEQERAGMVRRIIAKGRASGIVIIAATQKPQSDVIPTGLRDMIQQRVSYATTTVDMTDTILGKGTGQLGGAAHSIAASERGVCYVVNEGSRTPQRARTFWIPDEEVAGIAQSTSHLRIELPWLDKASTAKPKFGQVIAEDTVEYDDSIVEEASDLDFSDFNPSDFE